MAKIQRNDPCPCGSGKKYKHCCGTVQSSMIKQYKRQDMQQADFVINNIDRDWLFLCNALQRVIGHEGYQFCKKHYDELSKDLETNMRLMKNAVVNDELGVYSETEENSRNEHIWNTMAYGRELSEYSEDVCKAVEDFPSLVKRGVICIDQITLFHIYILDNIQRRFDDYFYAPSDNWLSGQHYGVLAHRGFDYLVGISLYLELQLGVHLYDMGFIATKQEKARIIKSYFNNQLNLDDVTDSMFNFLFMYVETIKKVTKDYNPLDELDFYRRIGALNDTDYKSRRDLIQAFEIPQGCAYQEYLVNLIGAICFNHPFFFNYARGSFPQCDFIKMLYGIEKVYDLFERKTIQSSDDKKADDDPYHEAVFLLLDELYGNSTGFKELSKLSYVEPDELTFEEEKIYFDSESGYYYAYNPAAKSTSGSKYRVRKLRMELYNLLSGKTIPLMMVHDPENPDRYDAVVFAGNYLMIPWLSNGTERTVHSQPFDGSAHNINELYSENIQDRKAFLDMEYRLTEIPVNCIEEYLNPNIYYNWVKIKEQNRALQEANDNLKKQMKMNHDLVRNIAHSATNYLNSERLESTGVTLHKAEHGDPSLEELHADGLLLMLQSEQEKYLTRQLKDAVRKYQSEMSDDERKVKETSLEDSIRRSISKTEGLDIKRVLEFSIKTVIARILFRNVDNKAKYIREKLSKNDIEWTNITSMFMTDVLPENTDEAALEWWNKNWSILDMKISDIWKKIKFQKDGAFYDLISEIVIELLVNALAHGNLHCGIKLEFGQVNNEKNRPLWAYIELSNEIGEACPVKSGVGLSSLYSDVLLLNRGERAIEHGIAGTTYRTKVWLDKKLLVAK